MQIELEILSIISVSFFTIPLYKALNLPNNCFLHFTFWILPQYFVIVFPWIFKHFVAISCTLIFVLNLTKRDKNSKQDKNLKNDKSANKPIYKPNKTFYPIFHVNRSVLILLVMICIFACDFSIFPEQHHKSDFYRNTLMDVGIGAFLFNNGCFYKKDTKRNIMRIISLLLLGFIRLLTLRSLNYNYNLAEYGRDLNFYFVLGFVYFLFPFVDSKHNFKLAFLLSIAWEYVLRIYEYDLWIFSEYRKNWFDLNKEGFFAVLPSLIIFMYANCLGKIAFTKTSLKQSKIQKKVVSYAEKVKQTCFYLLNTAFTNNLRKEHDKLVHLCKYTIIFFYIYFTSSKLSLSSRRLGNMCYTSWILFLHSFLIFLTFIVNTFVNTEVFEIAEFLSKNMLTYFLWSNVLVLFFSFFSKDYGTFGSHVFNIFYLCLSVFVPFGATKMYNKLKSK